MVRTKAPCGIAVACSFSIFLPENNLHNCLWLSWLRAVVCSGWERVHPC